VIRFEELFDKGHQCSGHAGHLEIIILIKIIKKYNKCYIILCPSIVVANNGEIIIKIILYFDNNSDNIII